MKILHLTLKKRWFDLIAKGEKTIEYREMKPYWTKRLFVNSYECKSFDVIHFKNGYAKNSPRMEVVFKGSACDGFQYLIYLGKVLEIQNWRG